MEGIQINGISLFLGKLPGRKQECFYFQKGSVIYSVAYISEKNLPEAKMLWADMLKGVPPGEG